MYLRAQIKDFSQIWKFVIWKYIIFNCFKVTLHGAFCSYSLNVIKPYFNFGDRTFWGNSHRDTKLVLFHKINDIHNKEWRKANLDG